MTVRKESRKMDNFKKLDLTANILKNKFCMRLRQIFFQLLALIKHRKMRYFGQLMRKSELVVLQVIMYMKKKNRP